MAYTSKASAKESVRVDFAGKLQKLIADKGWRGSELARRANLTRQSVSEYLRAEAYPSKAGLDRIAAALGVSADDLALRSPELVECPSVVAMTSSPRTMLLKIERIVSIETGRNILALLAQEDAAHE